MKTNSNNQKYRKISKIYSPKQIFSRGLSPGGLSPGGYLLLSEKAMFMGQTWNRYSMHISWGDSRTTDCRKIMGADLTAFPFMVFSQNCDSLAKSYGYVVV